MWRAELDACGGGAGAAVSHDNKAMASGGFIKRDPCSWFVASDTPSDLLVRVGVVDFHLHKYPLVSRSGRVNRQVYESPSPGEAAVCRAGKRVDLSDIPGGPEAFELAAKFCYGAAVDLTASTISAVRCAAEYLEMTEDLEEGNLIFKAEAFLSYVVLASWRDSVVVLKSCEALSPWAENLQIVRRCCESIAGKVCADPASARGVVRRRRRQVERVSTTAADGSCRGSPVWGNEVGSSRGSSPGGPLAPDWWFEDVALLRIDHFVRVITASKVKGMRPDLIGAAIAFYASKWLPGLSSPEEDYGGGSASGCRPLHMVVTPSGGAAADVAKSTTTGAALSAEAREQRMVVESLISLIPPQRDAVRCEFLLRLLRLAAMLKVAPALVTELEKRVGMQLEQASLPDLLIPSYSRSCEPAYDVGLMLRLIEHFLVIQNHQATEEPTNAEAGGDDVAGPNSRRSYGTNTTATATTSRVARLVDSYLTEVARDQNLPLTTFQMLAEALPDSARTCDDGLYRAVDSYLKVHPKLPEHERKRLCRVMNCHKLSADACMHAAHNERLPLRIVVRIIFSEQVKISNAVASYCAALRQPEAEHDHHQDQEQQQPQHCGLPSSVYSYHHMIPGRKQLLEGTPLSFQEGWAAAKKDINTLKFQVESMKAKYLELQNDVDTLRRQLERMTSSSLSAPTADATPVKAGSKGTVWGGWKMFGKLTRMSGTAEVDETRGPGERGVAAKEQPRKPRRRNSVS